MSATVPDGVLDAEDPHPITTLCGLLILKGYFRRRTINILE
jgi:hypothetical protein